MLASTSTAAATALLILGGFLSQLPGVNCHVYLLEPFSRNLWGTVPWQEGYDSPYLNHCPHCFQSRGPAAVRTRGGGAVWPHFKGLRAENGNYLEGSESVSIRHGVCGDPEQTAQEGDNRYAQETSVYPVLEEYTQGQIIDVKIVISTYHWGHTEFFICDMDDIGGPDNVVTQACFEMNPVDRDPNDDNQPVDPNHRGRMVLDPGCRASETDQTIPDGAYPGQVSSARLQLPEGLACERCVFQMVYYTANSCTHEGYAEFNDGDWPEGCASTKGAWLNEGVSLCGDGASYPEEFWNCADIRIVGDGDGGQTEEEEEEEEEEEPAPTPAPEEEEEEEPAPTPAPEEEEEEEEGEGPEERVCEEPQAAYEQCGGTQWVGSTCCEENYYCEVMAECYSECRKMKATEPPAEPVEDDDQEEESVDEPTATDPPTGCAEEWGTCGGSGHTGPTCCASGSTCVADSEWYSQCIPAGF